MARLCLVAPPAEWGDEMEQRANDGRLHLVCPAGIGDFAWIWAKFHHVAREQDTVFYFPHGEQHRAGQLARLVGAQCDYLPGVYTPWVWRQPQQPELPPANLGGWLPLHANGHLEAGKPLRDWYPDLPLRYPEPDLGDTVDDAPLPYVLVFTCHEGYMCGNLSPWTWIECLREIERTVAPVRFVGAGHDVPFIRQLREHLRGGAHDLLDRPLAEVLLAARRARLFLGVAGGPLIAGLMQGAPSFFFYPRHLPMMPGTWEPEGSAWDWCLVREAREAVFSGRVAAVARRGQEQRRKPFLPGLLSSS